MATIQYGVTDKGFVRKPVTAILESLNNRFTGKFGSTFDVSPESPDGQVIGIVADEIDQCWMQSELTFNAYRPGAMSGIGLDNICELSKTKRYVLKPSQATVICTGTAGVVIPKGSIVSDGTMDFTTDFEITIPGDVTVVAAQSGEYYVAPNSINTVKSDIDGWTGVNNTDEGQTGITYEQDPALRVRRDKTTARSGATTAEAMYAALADLDLSYIRIRDNDTGDDIGTQPAGTIWVVVDGGTTNDIARRIYSVKTGGVPTFGNVTVTVKDSKGYPHDVNFSRTEPEQIHVVGTFRRRVGANVSSNDAIKSLQDAMINYLDSLQPGEAVVWSYLFAPLNAAVQNISITSLFIGLTANPTGTDSIPIEINKRARAIVENIKFTDVTV